MDEMTEKKIRDLKLKIIMAEKELFAVQHKSGLGAMLHAGHPSQISKAGERDRERIESKLENYKTKLAALESGETTPESAEKKTAAPNKAAVKKTKPKTDRKK